MKKTSETTTIDPGLETFALQQAESLENAAYRRAALLEAIQIATVETIIDELDAAREALLISKEALARSISTQSSVVRRLFNSPDASPTLSNIARVAAGVGMRIAVVPMEPEEQETVFAALYPSAQSAASGTVAKGNQ